MNNFVHLECFSEYSISKSIIRIDALITQAKQQGFEAIALTDMNNFFAAFKFFKAAKSAGIKPIFGATITIDGYEIIALCMNEAGYQNLSALISASYEQPLNFTTLCSYSEGLIVLSGEKSQLAYLLLDAEHDDGQEYLQRYQQAFPQRHYIAIKRTKSARAEDFLHKVVPLAHSTQTPLVATNDVLFLNAKDYPTHEAKVCITEGGLIDDDKREKKYSEEQYLKSAKSMAELFADIPEAIENSAQIALRCNYKFNIPKDTYFLPDFPTPNNEPLDEFFVTVARENLAKIIQRDGLDEQQYYERLEFELETILPLHFAGYFLIVADFIAWAKANDIPVGLGRGSGAGSLVAYSLGITGVDPLKYDLLFERFLNPQRVSMPDFDIDFSPTGRDRVIEYVAQKYGREKVSQIITFGTMAARGVVRDVGRVLGMSYGFCDDISKLLPSDLDISFDKTFHYEDALRKKAEKDKKEYKDIRASKEQDIANAKEFVRRYSSEEDVTSLVDLAKELEGLSRNVGTHAGGVIIAPTDIAHFCPTYKGSGDDDPKVCQFDKKDVESIGLVKFDFLGLSNLDTIKKTVDTIHRQTGTLLDMNQINLADDLVYELYRKGDTTGLFQMESAGMRKYLKELQPTSINDIIAMNALYRPGAMDYIDNYIGVKHGTKEVEFPHPILEEVLTPTNGVFVYQEQVMRAAQKMAGFSLGDADILRRAMGKKDPEEMAKMRGDFVSGAFEKNQVDAEKANEVFDYIDKFSGYGFNKSHSAAYALISYQTAYLKTYYRAPFMAAVISGVANDTDRVAEIVREVRESGMHIIPPSINLSTYDWINTDDNTLIYGLGSIKGVGFDFVQQLSSERENGNYQDLFDFCLRTPKKYLNKRAIEALIYAGAFDEFGQNKRTLINTYADAIKHAEITQNAQLTGQGLLFAGAVGVTQTPSYNIAKEYSFKELLVNEKLVMGFYFSAHPVDEYAADLEELGAQYLRDISIRGGKEFTTIALIEHVFYKETKKGLSADVILTDGVTKLSAKIFSNKLGDFNNKLTIGSVVFVACNTLKNDNKKSEWTYLTTVIESITNIETLKANYIKYVSIHLTPEHGAKLSALKELLITHSGNTIVALHYTHNNTTLGSAFLPPQFNIDTATNVIAKIEELLGDNTCKVEYKHK